MRVQDVMSKAVQTVSAAASADEAWDLMRARSIHHLVVTEGGRIAGILSDRDIGGRHGATVRRGRSVSELMVARPVAVPPETTVRKAANLMRGHSIGSVIVARAGRPVGIVTTADLLDLLGRGADRGVVTTTRWTLRHRAPHRKRRQAAAAW